MCIFHYFNYYLLDFVTAICLGFIFGWASLVAQRLKCLPAIWETRVWSLGQEDPLDKEMVTHSSILAWRIPWMEEPGRLPVHGVAKSRTQLSDFLSLSSLVSRFWIFVLTSLNVITNHLWNLHFWPEIKPWVFGVGALTPRPWTTRELMLGNIR